MLIRLITLIALLTFGFNVILAQQSQNTFQYSAYAEMYYSFDNSKPVNNEKSNFIYNHKKHNKVSFNLVFAKASYSGKNFRSNLALMTGDYAKYNLSSEPKFAQHIFEANAGIKISKKYNLWIDAGIFPSHIGFESAVGADCRTVTRSLCAEGSPYYESGLKLGYTNKKDVLSFNFFVLNGWQRIKPLDGTLKPAIGFQLIYKPNDKWTLNYSNFIGKDKPDSIRAIRFFQNLFATYDLNEKMGFIFGFDFGTDKFNTDDYGIWYSPVLILYYKFSTKNFVAFRSEYFSDRKQIIVNTNTQNGFQTYGFSINYDCQITKILLWRIEAKNLVSRDKIFSLTKSNNFSFTTSLSIKL